MVTESVKPGVVMSPWTWSRPVENLDPEEGYLPQTVGDQRVRTGPTVSDPVEDSASPCVCPELASEETVEEEEAEVELRPLWSVPLACDERPLPGGRRREDCDRNRDDPCHDQNGTKPRCVVSDSLETDVLWVCRIPEEVTWTRLGEPGRSSVWSDAV